MLSMIEKKIINPREKRETMGKERHVKRRWLKERKNKSGGVKTNQKKKEKKHTRVTGIEKLKVR